MANIKERPEEIEGRLVPGHCKGDLILGSGGASAIGTLVERTTRFVVLVRMPTRKADIAASAFAGALNAIPAPLRRTPTHDQGKEMANHAALARDTDMRIFFADPHAPWQRGANENINGLLRQYFPRGTPLSGFDQDDLDLVASSLNDRPRKALDFATPNEQFKSLLAAPASANQASTGVGVRSGTRICPRAVDDRSGRTRLHLLSMREINAHPPAKVHKPAGRASSRDGEHLKGPV
jgi:IS30 family transposase